MMGEFVNILSVPDATGTKVQVVDIADMAVSADPAVSLVTYSLGSCLGVAVYDPVARVGGMIHCMLPISSIDPEKARQKPCMFVDTGVSLLLKTVFDLGVRKSRAVVRIAGCARVFEQSGMFRIGERNCAVVRKILWKNDILIAAEDVGGEGSRTIRLEVGNGRFFVKRGKEIVELR